MLLRAACAIAVAASALLLVTAQRDEACPDINPAWARMLIACAAGNAALGAAAALAIHDAVSGQIALLAAVILLFALRRAIRTTRRHCG